MFLPGVPGRSSVEEPIEGGDGEHVALELDDAGVAEVVVVVVVAVFEITGCCTLVLVGVDGAVVAFTTTGDLFVTGGAFGVDAVAVEVGEPVAVGKGFSAIIFLPPGPVITISCLPVACN